METKVNLLLDQHTAQQLVVDAIDFINNGINITNTVDSLTHEKLLEAKYLVVIQDFARLSGYFGDFVEQLNSYNYLYNVEIIYLYEKETEFLSRIQDNFKCYKINMKAISSELILSSIYGNIEVISEELNNNFREIDLEDLARNVAKVRSVDYMLDNVQEVKLLAIDYLKRVQDINDLDTSNVLLKAEVNLLREDHLINSSLQDELGKTNLELMEKLERANARISEMATILSKDIYTKMDLSKYNNAPIILYIKEFEKLIHFNKFLEILKDSINIKLQLSCKVVRLVDRKFYRYMSSIPEYYYKCIEDINVKNIYVHDFIIKQGNYESVLDLLLQNKTNVDVLIIYDEKDYNDYIIEGQGIITFNTCRNENNIEKYGLSVDNTIVNNSRSSLSWNSHKDYHKYKDNKEYVFQTLSNESAITEILTTIMYFINMRGEFNFES